MSNTASSQSFPNSTDMNRPNILWLTCEDIGPHLGAYGLDYADTPNLDALADRGMIFRNAWSNAPVCAPARTGLITSVYPTCTGAQHMRSMLPISDELKMYPQTMREAGYYCTNNSKEDYNLAKPGKVWDDSSNFAHWRNRDSDGPFFSIFNYTVSHESGIRKRPHKLLHDPNEVEVPPYHPDTPQVRHDWAQYHDTITAMDEQAGQQLRELEADGLTEDTIIVFYGDHGSGMPGHKRCARDAGLRVAFLIAVPEKYAHLAPENYTEGGETNRPVSFVDLAPTLLSTAGIQPPEFMQGKAFMGEYEDPPKQYNYGYRGRMDERYDMVRCLRDERYIYIRNYMPHLPMGQYVDYMFQTPTTRIWHRLWQEGKLTQQQAAFWERRPPEELYDLQKDPHEVNNLAESDDHSDVLQRMRAANREFLLDIRDVGFLPEPQIHSRSEGTTPYDMGRDPDQYPLEKIMEVAETATFLRDDAIDELAAALADHDDPAVRYWGAMGMLMRGDDAIAEDARQLRAALKDDDKSVRTAAAEALGRYSNAADAKLALPVLVELADANEHGPYVAMMALNAIDRLGDRAAPALDEISQLPEKDETKGRRVQYGIPNLLEKIISDLQ